MMKKEKQKQIEQLIEQTFNNIQKLQDLLTKKDLEWADKNCDEDDVALSISGFGENLIDWGKMFRS
jgi:Na+/phosphate symporter